MHARGGLFFKALKIMAYAFFKIILFCVFLFFFFISHLDFSCWKSMCIQIYEYMACVMRVLVWKTVAGELRGVRTWGKLQKPRARFLSLYYWHLGCTILWCRSARCRMPGSTPVPYLLDVSSVPTLPSPIWQPYKSPDIAKCPQGVGGSGKSLPVENHWSRSLQFIKCFHVHLDHYLILSLIKTM